jgi:hypothetical protein
MKLHIHTRNVLPQVLRLVSISLLLSSSESAGQSALPLEAFQGSWKFTFAGSLNGSGTAEVTAEGRITVHVSLVKHENLFTNPIALNVSNSGELSGDIFLWPLAVGRIEGSLSPSGDLFGRVSIPLFDVGSVSGRFAENSGGGTYQTVAGNGTWSAQKN